MVEAAGRLHQLDRAFATFQEYLPLFGVRPDIHSFNALLRACSAGHTVNMHTLLSVLEDIEAHGCTANSLSFGLLLEGMCRTCDFRVLDDVLRHCTLPATGDGSQPLGTRDTVLLPPRALRRVAVALGKTGDWAAVDRVLVILDRQQAGRQHGGSWMLGRGLDGKPASIASSSGGDHISGNSNNSRKEGGINDDSNSKGTPPVAGPVGWRGGIPAFLVYRLQRIKKRQLANKRRQQVKVGDGEDGVGEDSREEQRRSERSTAPTTAHSA